MKTISVIIPAYNASETLAKALESVLVQDMEGRKVEVVIVDDGSSDDTAAVAECYVRRYPGIIRLLHQKNAGPAAARNAGVAAAEGDYIAFLDADDEWLPGKLRAQMELLEANPGVALVCTSRTSRLFRLRPTLFRLSFRSLLLSNKVYTSSVVIRKCALEAAGGFDPSRRLSEDYELWLKVARQGKILVLNKPLMNYSKGGTSFRFWTMERSELETYHIMYEDGFITGIAYIILRWWSLAKYLVRRIRWSI
ncbi:MAG: glycosyltransferase family 2 protein [Spirochaetaceae bacterium]|nr:glycosyltransferase family 2 protein [Spirochaetaceae bacterium]